MAVNLQQFLTILACPACRSRLVVDGDGLLCQSAACRMRFAIKDDIPVMLTDEATVLPTERWSEAMKQATPT